MIYSICDFYVEFTPKYRRLKDRSEKYIAKDQSVKPELSIEISDAEISSYAEKYSADKDLAEYVLLVNDNPESVLIIQRTEQLVFVLVINDSSFGFLILS